MEKFKYKKKKKRTISQKQKDALKKAREQKKLKKMMEKQMEKMKKEEKPMEPKKTDTEILTTSFTRHFPSLVIGAGLLAGTFLTMHLLKSKMSSYKKQETEEPMQLNQMEVMEKYMKIQETESVEKSQPIPENSMKTTKLNLHF